MSTNTNGEGIKVCLSFQGNLGYAPDQVTGMTLECLLEAVQTAIEEHGPQAEVVLHQSNNGHGANYGALAQYEVFEAVEDEDEEPDFDAIDAILAEGTPTADGGLVLEPKCMWCGKAPCDGSHDQDGYLTAGGSPVASDRAETEPCQKGTAGCCVDHPDGRDTSCETW